MFFFFFYLYVPGWIEHTKRILNYSAKIIDYPILKRNIFFILVCIYSLVTKNELGHFSFTIHIKKKKRDEQEKKEMKKKKRDEKKKEMKKKKETRKV